MGLPHPTLPFQRGGMSEGGPLPKRWHVGRSSPYKGEACRKEFPFQRGGEKYDPSVCYAYAAQPPPLKIPSAFQGRQKSCPCCQSRRKEGCLPRVAARHISQIFGNAKYCAFNACRSFFAKIFSCENILAITITKVAKGVTALRLLRLHLPLTRLMGKGEQPRAKLLPKQRRRG